MIDAMIIGLILLILGGAAFFVYRAKKNGAKCIGCPSGRNCSGNCCDCGSK